MNSKATEMDEVESRAASWILEGDRGAMTPEQQSALESWLSEDALHREAYLRLKKAWQVAAGFSNWRPIGGSVDANVLLHSSPGTAEEEARVSGKVRVRARERPEFKPQALAAGLFLLIALGVLIYHWNGANSATTTYTTDIGGYQRVLLEDGSVLQLNTDTQLQKSYSASRREIRMVRGEAYFEVARDSSRPFEVVAGKQTVRALGTAFTVRLQSPEAIEVVVTDGKVAVKSIEKGDALVTSTSASSQHTSATLITAGESARASRGGTRLARVDEGELARRLAWQGGELRFQKQTLAEVVAEFNRYNRRRIEIADPDLAGVVVGGNFKANDLESFIAAMSDTLGVQAEESPERIRLKGSAH